MLPAPCPVRPAARRRVAPALLLAAVALVASGARASAQTYYVDNQSPAASDTGPGTELEPYRTILGAVTARKGPGITIVVKPGTYREQVSVPASGAAGQPYVLRASGPGVVVDGSDDLSGTSRWAVYSGTVHRATSVDWVPKQVFVDGARLTASTAAPASLPVNAWVHVAGEGLYVNLGGANPGSLATLVSRRSHAFTMSNRSFVTLDGFGVLRTNDRGVNLNTCADVALTNLSVGFAFSYGIQAVGCQRLLIERNTVVDGAHHGIGLTAGTTASTVRDNESARNVHPTIRQANGVYLYGAPANTLSGNRVHHNQDTGMHFGAGSNDCVAFNNRSWANGDHGYDHLGATGVAHIHDLAYGNWLDGFSFEGNAPGGRLHNSISVDNGIVAGGHDLWVDAESYAGFVSDHNLFWNSTSQPIIRIESATYATLAAFQSATGLDLHSVQSDPRFAGAATGDFTPLSGSPALDAADSGVPSWPATDAMGHVRFDVVDEPDTGAGPVAYADLGPIEAVIVAPADQAPVVLSPGTIRVVRGGTVSFRVTASDPDGQPILSLLMEAIQMPAGHTAQFVPDPGNGGGTFTWATGSTPTGDYRVRFIGRNALADTSATRIQIRRKAGLDEADGAELPGPVALSNGYPNPSPGPVEFTLSLAEESVVEWGVYDMQGRAIWSEARSEPPGVARLAWSGRDARGRRAPTGMYFARVQVGEARFVRRIVRF